MMSKEESTTAVHAHYEALNWGDSHQVVGFFATDFVWCNRATGQIFTGSDGYLAYLAGWRAAFPDFWVEINHLAIYTQSAVCEYVLRGTHNGTLTLPSGSIPATGRPLNLVVCETFQVENGRLAQANTYYDQTTLLQQLGILMKPGTDRAIQDVLLTPITYQN
jgi:steroid delta-isomerase-like uncharacterized protein